MAGEACSKSLLLTRLEDRVSFEPTPGDDGGLPAAGEEIGPGSRVAGYVVLERVGQGGMAVVFRARDEELGRVVALKVLAPVLAEDEGFRQRFIRESRAAAAVDDPHIIPVHEAGEADGVLFIAMRFVAGGDVRSLLRLTGPLPGDRAAAIISSVAVALDAAHAAGLVHRDVKPANMLVDTRPGRPDHVYLSDFGLAKGALSSVGLTGTGLFLGTPDYISPEQIAGHAVDGRADQYSLACAAYELLAGEPPFVRNDELAVIYAHASEPPPALTARRPDLSTETDSALARALAKDPADRYVDCREFTESLRAALGLPPYDPRLASGEHAPPVGLSSQAIAQVHPGPDAGDGQSAGSGDTEVSATAGMSEPADGPVGFVAPKLGDNTVTAGIPARASAGATGPVRAVRPVVGRRRPVPGRRAAVIVSVVVVLTAAAAVILATRGGPSIAHVASPTRSVAQRSVSSPAALRVDTEPIARLRVPSDKAGLVLSVAFSPDGKTIAVGETSTYLWNASTHSLIATMTDPSTWGVGSVAFSPDGKTIAVGDYNGSTYLWSSSRHTLIATLPGPLHQHVDSVAFSPDGKIIAAGGDYGSTYLWSASTHSRIALLPEPSGKQVGSVAFSPDGKVIATGNGPASSNGSTYLWDVSTHSLIAIMTDPSSGQGLGSVAFSPDGQIIAVGGTDGSIYLWDASTYSLIATLTDPAPQPYVNSVAFSPDGKIIAIGDNDNHSAYLLDVSSHSQIATLTVPSQGVLSVAFSPDGKTVATGDWSGTTSLWQVG